MTLLFIHDETGTSVLQMMLLTRYMLIMMYTYSLTHKSSRTEKVSFDKVCGHFIYEMTTCVSVYSSHTILVMQQSLHTNKVE